jgi:hypothetical protein
LRDEDPTFFRDWFRGFCRGYYRDDPGEQLNIALKEKHSLLVADNALHIAKGESLDAGQCGIAEVAGLLHDIGRFPQYARYRTFLDKASVNHGQLGAETLLAEGVLTCLSQREQNIVVNAVRFHNAFSVPEGIDSDAVCLTKLVRDSDKIDIWRVFCEYFEGSGGERADAVPLGLPDLPAYSDEAVAAIMDSKVISLADVRTLNDLKLLQLSWFFDLNFGASFRLAAENGSISRMARLLPDTEEVSAAVSMVRDYALERSQAP